MQVNFPARSKSVENSGGGIPTAASTRGSTRSTWGHPPLLHSFVLTFTQQLSLRKATAPAAKRGHARPWLPGDRRCDIGCCPLTTALLLPSWTVQATPPTVKT